MPPSAPGSPPPAASASSPDRERLRGLGFAFAAYGAWGLLPLYFKSLAGVPPLEILAHRICWAVLFLLALAAARGQLPALRAAFRRDRLRPLAATTALISVNWLVYIWAVLNGRVMEASLGYFMNPLVNVLLGVVFLGESLARVQQVAVGLAALGVLSLVVSAGGFPWLPLVLAFSFGLYGLVRKKAGTDAIGGLFAETLLLAPLALAWLVAGPGTGHFGHALRPTLLLAAAGAITALPLVWFALAVARLRLSTIGLVQYIAPTMQFALAVVLFHEPFRAPHAVAFGCIWTSLAIYTWDALRRARSG